MICTVEVTTSVSVVGLDWGERDPIGLDTAGIDSAGEDSIGLDTAGIDCAGEEPAEEIWTLPVTGVPTLKVVVEQMT